MTQKRVKNSNAPKDVDVITTHVNADFDALASMVAASKLYPDAMLVLPGAQERNLRNFFVESTCYFFNFVKLKNVPMDRVRRLILVDTRQADRIGALAALLKDPDLEVHIYDHHPDSETDVKGQKEMVESVGAAVTILTRLLREAGVNLNEDEATLLALGIYEDTGSFTFPSTTQKDYDAAAWLLGQGANLNLVSSLITRQLTVEEVGVLNDLIRAAVKQTLGGIEVVVAEVSRERYVAEFAVLVHRFMDMDNLDAIFALGRMEGRVYLVARSRVPEVNVGAVAAALGGGGHATAASATMRDMTLVEAKERLQAVLKTHINPTRFARDLMTSPVVSVPASATLEQAHAALTRYGLGVVPVVDEDKVLGILSLDIVEKSLHHGLGELKVVEYMDRHVSPLTPDSTLGKVEEAVVGRRQRLVPVMEEERLVGVITRTDLLNALIENPPISERPGGQAGNTGQILRKNVRGLIKERFPKKVGNILTKLGRVAEEMGYKAYLVGGSVRDMFLRRNNLDLDIVIEGDAAAFAQRFVQQEPKVGMRSHKKFKTAKLLFEEGLAVDLATARLEYYQAPAALPIVELSSLKLDLYRRDFTINTLAVSLNPAQYGELLDFFEGLKDIKERVIRVLHNLSFVEDPTRVFRAVRFEQRFGFRIGKFTEGLIKNALKVDAFKRLTGARLFGEFKLMMDEERVGDCLIRLKELKLLPLFHPKLKLNAAELALIEDLEEALAWYRLSFLDRPIRQWMVYILALADPLSDEELNDFCLTLAFGPKLRAEIIQMRRQAKEALNRLQRNKPSPSLIYRLLNPLKPAYQILIMAKAKRDWTKRAVNQYMTSLIKVKPELGGKELQDMGLEPGPMYKEILDRLLAARLDGQVKSRDDELSLVKKEFGSYLEQTA